MWDGNAKNLGSTWDENGLDEWMKLKLKNWYEAGKYLGWKYDESFIDLQWRDEKPLAEILWKWNDDDSISDGDLNWVKEETIDYILYMRNLYMSQFSLNQILSMSLWILQ